MSDLVRITFKCDHCGGTVLEVEDDLTDASVVRCKGCGAEHGTFGDLKAQAVQRALGSILDVVTKSLKK